MRKVVMAAAALVAMAGAEQAQAADQTITLTASVAASCVINTGTTVTSNNLTLGTVSQSNPVTATTFDLNGPTTGDVTGQVTCTGAATITLISANQGLKHTDTAVTAGNKIAYTARANLGTISGTASDTVLDTSTLPTVTGSSIAGSGLRDLAVRVTLNGGETSLTAGNFTDTLTVRVNPS
jgi:hypothetical protein